MLQHLDPVSSQTIKSGPTQQQEMGESSGEAHSNLQKHKQNQEEKKKKTTTEEQ